jgi:protein phosphatase 1 regulatory subunit 7
MSSSTDTPPVIDEAGAPESTASPSKSNGLQSHKSGWDGKLRLDKNKKAILANPEALTDAEYSDEDAPPVDQIEADEGTGLGLVVMCAERLTSLSRLA